MGFTGGELSAKSHDVKTLGNPGLKFSFKNGIFIFEEHHFFVVIIIFSGIMQYSNFA